MLAPDRADARWSFDYLGRDHQWSSLQVLAIVNDYTRECFEAVADNSL